MFLTNIIFQRILRVNSLTPFMVHYTSKIILPAGISVRLDSTNTTTLESLAAAPQCYIQAYNGVIFGTGVFIGPNVKIISANHDPKDLTSHLPNEPIVIGNNVLISANVVILPSIKIGDGCIIGAGSVVTKDLPDNAIAVGNPAKTKSFNL